MPNRLRLHKKKGSRKGSRKGGFIAETIKTAAVPATLLLMQNRYLKGKKLNSKKHRGGDSAAEYMLKTVGDGDTQFNNVFGPENTTQSNNIVPLNLNELKGGKKSRKSSACKKGGKKSKKGGYWSQVINQAMVPFALLGLQQTYNRRNNSNNKTRRNRH